MAPTEDYGVFGYRFQDSHIQSVYQLFAVGYENINDAAYDWDGMKRNDGPLYLFQYTLSGCGQMNRNEQSYTVPAGTAFLAEIPGNHRYCLPPSSPNWEFYFILFRQKHLAELWAELIRLLGPLPQLSIDSPAIRLLKHIYSEAWQGRIEDSYRASSLLYQFLMELSRSPSLKHKQPSGWPIKVQLTAEYIKQYYTSSTISLDDIAAASGGSKYHLTRTFAETTGMTPIAYMNKLRMERAVELLRKSELTIDEIARETGFANGSYFSKVFRKWVGFPPGEFRQAKELPSFDRFIFD